MSIFPHEHEHAPTCPLCATELEQTSFVPLRDAVPRSLYHVTCPKCKTSILVVSQVNQLGMTNIGVLTDLVVSEAQHMVEGAAISADHVLDVHQELKVYRGGYRGMFEEGV